MTQVEAIGGADLRVAVPPVAWMTVEVAAALVGVARKTIRNELSAYKERFDPPAYQRYRGWHRRLITARDLATLRAMHPIFDTYIREKKS